MTARELTEGQARLLVRIRECLVGIGYSDNLLRADYRFSDWFVRSTPERSAKLAAFGQTPLSYETACFAVLASNGKSGAALIQDHRALGAPFAFEIGNDRVHSWIVGRTAKTTQRIESFGIDEAKSVFDAQAKVWEPGAILRAKNVASGLQVRQLELFDYDLVPEIEKKIHEKLKPRMEDACAGATSAYRQEVGREPDPEQLFQLAFWMLAGKVLKDREVPAFQDLSPSSPPDEVLARVATHYDQKLPALLNRMARSIVHRQIWEGFDYRNLSPDVLTRVWTEIFVDPATRKTLGIHPTPRVVAKFMVDALPIKSIPEDRVVLEPCCGSGTFLLAAFQVLRDLAPISEDRHDYIKARLIGFEKEPFGKEITRLSLTLADVPNPNGWDLHAQNVFTSQEFPKALARAKVVLCNPPFEDFDKAQRAGDESIKKPAALLKLVLEHLHPDGILGFVLPRLIIDGEGYRDIRKTLAERYADISIVALPDKAFRTSSVETALLLAYSPKDDKLTDIRISFSKVRENEWSAFKKSYRLKQRFQVIKSVTDATKSLAVPPLARVWAAMPKKTLSEYAEIHRGLEWNIPLTKKGRSGSTRKIVETGNRALLVRSKPQKGYCLGVPPLAKINAFEDPETAYLCMQPDRQRSQSFNKPWEQPKVIVNKTTRSRGNWRVACVADFRGLCFYQTFIGVWPHDPTLTNCIAAVLNGPVGNAVITATEGKIDITTETLGAIPLPFFSEETKSRIDSLIGDYREARRFEPNVKLPDDEKSDAILRRIDAAILQAYDLPPAIERDLLEFFRDEDRVVPFEFDNYYPEQYKPTLSLDMYLSPEYRQCTAEYLLETIPRITDPALIEALGG